MAEGLRQDRHIVAVLTERPAAGVRRARAEPLRVVLSPAITRWQTRKPLRVARTLLGRPAMDAPSVTLVSAPQDRQASFIQPTPNRPGIRSALATNVGDRLDGRFLLRRRAAQGGMATVFEAVDMSNGRTVAVKVVHHGSTEQVSRLEREAQVLARLEHPAIVRYVAHGTSAATAYLAMEWLRGEDLFARLRRGNMPVGEVIALGVRVADALGALHERRVVHRDIKPGNVFLVDGDVREAKILDLGLARIGEVPGMTKVGALLGTLGYMAPEQADGRRHIDARADVFSLGCLLYACSTGTKVFTDDTILGMVDKILHQPAPSLRERCPRAPAALDALVARMLAKDPDRRPHDGWEVAGELARITPAAA
jgi:serine/threonine protein kinase